MAFSGLPPVPHWDVFALGVTVYELLDGRRPYPSGRTVNGIPAFPDVRPVAPVCPDLPGSATSLLLAMVDPDGESRPTASVVAEELLGLLS